MSAEKHVPEVFRAAIFIIAKKQKQAKCQSTEKQIHKIWYIHSMKYYLAIKNTEVLIILNMDKS